MTVERESSVDVVVTKDVVIIQAAGEFDACSMQSLDEALSRAAAHNRDVMLALAAVSFVDIACAQAISRLRTKMSGRGRRLDIVEPPRSLPRLARTMRASTIAFRPSATCNG